jgi:uncharacterized protein (DUF2147 family)
MRSLFLLMSLLATLLFSLQAAAAQAENPYGYWLTENQRSVIKVEPCRDNKDLACGHIHWIIKDGMQYDSKNPDESKRNGPMCGLQLMRGFRQQDAANWIDGKIYKADEGDTYNATLQLLPTGKMIVRGYIGMPLFGKSQTWTPVSEKNYPHCKAAK